MKNFGKNDKKRNKVIVAMSGGIDSSVAAALLKRVHFDVVGVFMKFWADENEKKLLGRRWNKCCSPQAEKRARKVAQILDIPFYVLNFEKEFKNKVVDYFLNESKQGKTPNPCVVCNKKIKFGVLLEKALGFGADFIATGHYARNQKIKNHKLKTTTFKLLRAKDKQKDQSYFLWQLTQDQLRYILFPIGDYTKNQIKKLAKKFNLPVLKIKESQEICFVKNNIKDFLLKHIKIKKGKIFSTHAEILGEHQGLYLYTIGQRKGIKISGGPWYVLEKNLKRNILIVTKNKNDLEKKELIVNKINWISGKIPEFPLKIKARVRYRSLLSPAIVEKLSLNNYKITFEIPQRAITPGQSVVFYKKDELLGGGIIV